MNKSDKRERLRIAIREAEEEMKRMAEACSSAAETFECLRHECEDLPEGKS